jgi:hypothetical protein
MPPPPAPPVGGFPADDPAPAPAPEPPPADRAPLSFPAATLGMLDKVTGRVRRVDVDAGATHRAGALSLTLRACRAWPEADLPDSAAFLEINEIRAEDGIARRLFTGWMFASALAVSALEHPVYDVWLVACRTASTSSSR